MGPGNIALRLPLLQHAGRDGIRLRQPDGSLVLFFRVLELGARGGELALEVPLIQARDHIARGDFLRVIDRDLLDQPTNLEAQLTELPRTDADGITGCFHIRCRRQSHHLDGSNDGFPFLLDFSEITGSSSSQNNDQRRYAGNLADGNLHLGVPNL